MIREIRSKMAGQLVELGAPWSVYTYRPDDVNDVPTIVVDRPSVAIDVQHHIFTVPLVVIGRRDGTEDAQHELDDVASEVARLIAGPEFNVQRIEPSVATVAELTFPSYTITVTCGATYC